MIPLGCVTGRFQPIHHQHLELFEIALARCRQLIVAVTNPDTGAHHEEETSKHRHTNAANPFSFFERARFINAAVKDRGWTERVTLVPFNLTCPELWPQYVPLPARQFVRAFSEWERQKAQWFQLCGYAVSLLDGDPSERLSASDIRESMLANDDAWRQLVPSAIVPLLEEMLEQRAMEKRI
jgi:nicotinamide-nucleotide adenylyltransferase